MSATVIDALRKDPELFKRFREDPMTTLDEIAEMTGSSAPHRLTQGEIKLLTTLSREEFEVLYSIVDKFGAAGVKSFKL